MTTTENLAGNLEIGQTHERKKIWQEQLNRLPSKQAPKKIRCFEDGISNKHSPCRW
jgi:hypothetical protein